MADSNTVNIFTSSGNTVFKVLEDAGTYTETDEDIATCSATWFVHPFSSAATEAPVRGESPHPYYSNIYCKDFSIKEVGSGARITATYEGSTSTWVSSKSTTSNTITVTCSMVEEPIQTHPKFEEWAGTASSPKSGIFDDDGIFIGWKDSTVGGKAMLGITSYLVPTFNATVSSKSNSIPTLADTYSIGTVNGLPELPNGREWMSMGPSFTSLSDGTYDITENYMSSGTKGWNKYLYENINA